jgi:DNA-binding transcriptional LysR family regulator
MIDFRLLRYFVAVGEELHFGRAAQRLHVSQPALSRAIQELEGRLGVALFQRTKRRVRLTDAGSTLLEGAPRLFAELDRTLDETRRAGRGELGHLRIGFLPSATNELVPAAVRAFRVGFPAVTLELTEELDEAQLDGLARGRLDLGLVRIRRELDDVVFESLAEEQQCVAVPRGHRLAGRRGVMFGDLEGEDFVLWPRRLAPETHDLIIERCRAAGFSPRIVQEAPQAHTLLGLVAAGLGVSVLVRSYESLRGRDVVFVPIRGERSTLLAAWRSDRFSAARDNFLAVARRVARRRRGR